MKMHTVTKVVAVVSLLMFFWVEVAEAQLIRGSRPTYKGQYSEAIYYVENQYLNQAGVTEAAFTGGQWNNDVRSRTGEQEGLDAAPSECNRSITRDEEYEAESQILIIEDELSYATDPIRIAQLEADLAFYQSIIANNPCVWEFAQGEDLFVWGFFGLIFNSSDVNYNVSWRIDGNGQSWTFDGSINGQSGLTDPDDPTYEINPYSVLLDAEAPAGLTPGDYAISVGVSISSDKGGFVYASDNHPDGPYNLELNCIENPDYEPWYQSIIAFEESINHLDNAEYDAALDQWYLDNPEPDQQICGYAAMESGYDQNGDYVYTQIQAPTSFYSETELLRITPAALAIESDPIDQVNAPASFGLFALALSGLMVRRKKRR